MTDDDLGGRRRARWALIGILALAAVVRLAQLNAQSLTADEVKDLALARGGVANLQASEDRFPPLYHALLGAWLKVVPADVTGRGFSVLCGVLTVAAMAGLGRTLGGGRAGLWAAGITAVAPLAVWYSVEARAYGLYLLLATIALWQFTASAGEGRPRNWAGFAVAAIAGAYAHYYFGLLIAIAGLTWLGSRPRGEQLRRGLIAFAVIAVATAPTLWLLKHDLDQPWGYARTSRFTLPGLAYTYFSYLTGYTLGPSLRELHTADPRAAAVSVAAWAGVLGAAAAALLVMAPSSFAPAERWRRVGWFAAFCLAPAAILGGVSLAAGFGYNVRHAVWAFAPLATLLAVGAAQGRPRWLAWSATALIAGAFAAAHVNRLTSLEHRNEDVRSVAEHLIAADEAAPTFVASGYMSKPLAAYLPPAWPTVALPDAVEDDGVAEAVAEVRRRTAAGEAFWFVYSREFHGDPRGELLAALQAAFRLEPVGEFAGVRLFHGVARSPTGGERR